MSNIRIISGKFGGRLIQASSGDLTHPMGDRIRGSLFSILGDKVVDAEVLDIFAGTGSLGLESISRGAKSAIFVERDRLASKILSQNVDSLGLGDACVVTKIGASTWIDQNANRQFDLIFVDPPYNDMQFAVVAKLSSLLKPDGLLVLSRPTRVEAPIFEGMSLNDKRNYGDAELNFYTKNK